MISNPRHPQYRRYSHLLGTLNISVIREILKIPSILSFLTCLALAVLSFPATP